MSEWISAADQDPPDGLMVETKIDDSKGVRNIQLLCRMRGNRLWWTRTTGDALYVYYTPTHWRLAR